jgi:hypothetical protein
MILNAQWLLIITVTTVVSSPMFTTRSDNCILLRQLQTRLLLQPCLQHYKPQSGVYTLLIVRLLQP